MALGRRSPILIVMGSPLACASCGGFGARLCERGAGGKGGAQARWRASTFATKSPIALLVQQLVVGEDADRFRPNLPSYASLLERFARGRFGRPQPLDRPALRNDPASGRPRGDEQDFERRGGREFVGERGVLDAQRRYDLPPFRPAGNLGAPDLLDGFPSAHRQSCVSAIEWPRGGQSPNSAARGKPMMIPKVFGAAAGLALAVAASAPAEAQFAPYPYPVIIVPPPPAQNYVMPRPAPKPATPSTSVPTPEAPPPQVQCRYQGQTRVCQ